ncbi:hypothetical protein GCM10023219_15620 [Stakelama sediminis]|uniref:Type II secretion system protein H n=1 Tax=Stakelama sediminis TaxID=463200 RepID=A0A840YX43_9SPHN|nr:GspH/FimT family pseudopilin [Stakelama sediminis]MBB5718291.1 general secretion pathway protein H [Stakelama sediminis]
MRRNGFTLVEMLVVITVMALMAGVVVMSIGPRGNGPATAADRFASRVAAARDAAITTGAPVAVWVSASGYGFERYADRHWEPMTQKPFRGDDWGRDMVATMDHAERGRIAFDTIGLPATPVSVTLSDGSRKSVVTVRADGDVTVL